MCPQNEPDELNASDANAAGRDEATANRPETPADGLFQRFEAQLASLAPRAVQIDRDRLMFLAGQASVSSGAGAPRGPGWAWPAAFSAMSALAALLLVLVLRLPARLPEERPVAGVAPAGSHRAGSDAHPRNGRDEAGQLAETKRPAETGPASLSGGGAAGWRYVELRDRVLAMDVLTTGLDGWSSRAARSKLPQPPSAPAYHDLLDSLLEGG